MDKRLAFEFLIFKLLLAYLKKGKRNDLSLLKSIKLLFFISTNNTKEGDPLDIFNNYVAMPYGHVELDIYKSIKNDELQYFSFDNAKVIFKKNKISEKDFYELDIKTRKILTSALDGLLSINPKIIDLGAFDLVNLSHEWYSWDYYFNKVKPNYTSIISIPTEIIRKEDKKYFL